MKQRYDTVNENLWNLETRMDTMSRDQAEPQTLRMHGQDNLNDERQACTAILSNLAG